MTDERAADHQGSLRSTFSRRWRGAVLVCGLPVIVWAESESVGPASLPIVDVHAHVVRSRQGPSPTAMTSQVLGSMERFQVLLTVVLPPPGVTRELGRRTRSSNASALRDMAMAHRERLAFADGGQSLNPLLQDTAAADVTPRIAEHFRELAIEIAASGAAAFGEMAAEHLSSGRGRHPYESAPPDHPLMLVLADVAAEKGMPIDLHMEAVPRDMPMPEGRQRGPNPAELHSNIAALERLLEHNPRARIVWAHAGWDLTGERTTELMRQLLSRHDNLFMSIKIDPNRWNHRNAPFTSDGKVRDDWLAMLREFPDRFMIGSDDFFDEGDQRLSLARRFIDALPADIARPVASGNALRVYRLGGVMRPP